jgi:hypothetical protein
MADILLKNKGILAFLTHLSTGECRVIDQVYPLGYHYLYGNTGRSIVARESHSSERNTRITLKTLVLSQFSKKLKFFFAFPAFQYVNTPSHHSS